MSYGLLNTPLTPNNTDGIVLVGGVIMSKPICVVCGEKSVAHQMCDKHYRRWRKYGDPNKLQRTGAHNRTQHPLYGLWKWFSRHQDLSDEWKDFAGFRDELKEKPSEHHRLFKINKGKKLGPDNYYWHRTTPNLDAAARMRDWAKRNPLKVRNSRLKKYGITLKDYDRMLEEQNHKCKICGKSETAIVGGIKPMLSVDHCHETKKVRGLLCSACNRALGMFKDSPEILKNAIKYLRV